MAYATRCEWSVPDEQRCEAMCEPVRQTFQLWRRLARRCARPAEQSRDGRAVCWQHAALPRVKYLQGG